MAKTTKKKSKEQILLEKRIRERERYAKMKNDPQQRAIQQEKERKKYEAKKKKKQVKMVSNMNTRELRTARKNWRKNSKKYYERKTKGTSALPITPPDSPDAIADDVSSVQTNESQRSRAGRKKVHRDRSKVIQRNKRLESENSKLRREKEKYRKRYERLLGNRNTSARKMFTPKSRVARIMNKKDNKLIRRKLLFGEVVQEQLKKNYCQIKSTKEKYKYVSAILGDKKIFKKYRVLKNAKILLPSHSCKYKNNLRERKRVILISEKVRRDIQTFLEDDENSRQSPGKKDTMTKKKVKKQKRYLNDTLDNLHKKYLANNPRYKVSYTSFCRYRPFWITYQKVDMRDTCQCKKCANTEYVVSALFKHGVISQRTGKELIDSLCCTESKVKCLLRECSQCSNNSTLYNEFNGEMDIFYDEWATQEETYKNKKGEAIKVKHTLKIRKKISALQLVNMFSETVFKYMVHQGTIRNQYAAMKLLKVKMLSNEVILHMDFSENYACKYAEEIQAFHFGGSRTQVSLHTSSLLLKDDDNSVPKTKSFATFSESLQHNPPAILAHLEPVFEFISKERPKLKAIHFLSDSPSTQYRNKSMFYIFAKLIEKYFPYLEYSTWNFYEAGHGKGAPDGIGGTVKRTADNLVAQGKDISSLQTLVTALKERLRSITIHVVDQTAINRIDQKVVTSSMCTFKGTMKVHQICHLNKENKNQLYMKTMSCFCSHSLNNEVCEHFLLGHVKYPVEELSLDTTLVPLDLDNQMPNWNDITTGKFLLIKFNAENRKCTTEFKYVCNVLKKDDDDGEITVQGLTLISKDGTEFIDKENDVCYVPFENVIKILPEPQTKWKNRKLVHKFPIQIDVYEH